MENTPFTIERTYNAPIQKVWSAISDNNEMQKWYFKLENFKPIVGFEFRFTGGPTEDRQYLHICMVTEVIEGKKLTYSWRYDGYEGISYVTFELFAKGNQTHLKLTHAGLETFPINNKDFAPENFSAGWTHIIGTGLLEFLTNSSK